MQFYWSNFISTEYTFSLLDFTFTKYCCFLPLRFFNKGKGCCWLRFFLFVLPNHGKVSDNCYYWKPHVGFLRFGKWNQTVNINVDNSFTRKVFFWLIHVWKQRKNCTSIQFCITLSSFITLQVYSKHSLICNIFLFLNTHSVNWMIVLIQNEWRKIEDQLSIFMLTYIWHHNRWHVLMNGVISKYLFFKSSKIAYRASWTGVASS